MSLSDWAAVSVLEHTDELEHTVRTSLTADWETAGGRDDVVSAPLRDRDEADNLDGPSADELEDTVRTDLTVDYLRCPICTRRFRDRRRTSKEAALGLHVSEDHADFRAPRPKRPPREVETMEYLTAARRFIRKAGERTGDADEHELAALVGLRDDLEDAIRVAIAGQRGTGRSWAHIGAALGITRQSAQERYR